MLKQFYEKVLPTEGMYCVTTIDPESKRVINSFAPTLDEMFDLIDQAKSDEQNVFVTPNTFKDSSRRGDNAQLARSFFIDLDVGESDKKYATKEEALADLQQFLVKHELPPPAIIDTGGGIHAYWPFDQNVPIAEWKVYAEKFKAFCATNLLKIDLAVTADAARVMRCPETLNYKYDVPRETSVLTPEIYEYSFDVFKQFLGMDEPSATNILASVVKGFDNDVFDPSKFQNYEYDFSTIACKSLSDEGCNQIKNILINSRTIDEPLWRAGLSVAMRCVDADPAIYQMSEDYEGFNRDETLKKAEQTLSAKWAYTCEKFESLNPRGCDNCPFRGKIPSPTHIGRRIKEAPTDTPESVREDEDTQAVSAYQTYLDLFKQNKLFPFMRMAGGLYYQPPPKSEKGKKIEQEPILITKYDLFPVKRMFSQTDLACLEMRLILPHDGVRNFLLPMKCVGAADKLKEVLLSHDVIFEPEVGSLLAKYILKWTDHMVNIEAAEQMRMQMGWTEDRKGFVAGHIEIRDDGDILKTATSPLVRTIAKLLKTEGDYDEWKKAVGILNAPSMELHAFGMLTGFGAPLMSLTSTPGASICFTGGTGCGKTGALYAAISIFGAPRELGLIDGGATENGFVGRYLNLKNILLGLDEVSNAKAEHLSKIIHQNSQGKPKVRMKASVNAEREVEQNASTILFMTSNKDINDILQQVKASPDGEMARVIQFIIDKPHLLQQKPEYGRLIFETLHKNHGHAGVEFIKYYYKIGEQAVIDKISKWAKKYNEFLGNDTEYRFYENLIAATFAGAEIACEASIINFDLERIFKRVVVELVNLKSTATLNSTDYKGILNDFINRNLNGFLTINDNRVVTEPRGPLIGRSEIHTQMRYVSKTALRKHLAEIQISSRQLETVLKAEGVLTFTGKKRLGTGWPNGADIGAVAVYGFQSEIPEEVIDKS